VAFVNREWELARLTDFWTSDQAECLAVIGRRRVGKTFLLEHFAEGKRVVYYRCGLKPSDVQFALLGQALAERTDDPVIRVQPPSSAHAVFATIERLAQQERLLLILDEIPYWVARDDSLPATLQNWWDERGRHLNLVLVLCGSAVQMMERLFTGEAPLAGCLTGRIPVHPFHFRAAAQVLGFSDPRDALTAYCILGGVPLYLTFFRSTRSIRENILNGIISPAARLYVEPQAVFAAQHVSYDAAQAMDVLRAIAGGSHHWTDIRDAARLSDTQLRRVVDRLIGDLGIVERVEPIHGRNAQSHSAVGGRVRAEYHLTDNYFRFWFRFVEPNQGQIDFGDTEAVADRIMAELSDYAGYPFEALCHSWVGLASAAGALPVRASAVGTWWNPHHQLDVVGLDADRVVAITGECKWGTFDEHDLQAYLDHVRAVGTALRMRPDSFHLLFSGRDFADGVRRWAAGTRCMLIDPPTLLADFPRSRHEG
jgi:uncharacterized protein